MKYGPMDADRAPHEEIMGEKMALTDLERLTGELEELAQMLKAETRPQARWIILKRVQEIMVSIGKGIEG